MIKNLLLGMTLFASVSMMNAQATTNLVFDSEIPPTATTVELTFDFSGVSAGDVFEWQLFLADATGAPDWGSGRNIAYAGAIVPNAVGSGTQTISVDIYGSPVDGEVFTWTGKITLADGVTDTGFNNTGNLVTVSSTASTEDFLSKDSVVLFPNPVADVLNIESKGAPVQIASIIDITGKVVMKNINRTRKVDVSNLKQGFYFLRTVDNRSFKFLKK